VESTLGLWIYPIRKNQYLCQHYPYKQVSDNAGETYAKIAVTIKPVAVSLVQGDDACIPRVLNHYPHPIPTEAEDLMNSSFCAALQDLRKDLGASFR
jgi:hypothetical protein